MKLFVSWSGQRSHMIAEALHWWLRYILNGVEPWMSSTDIPKGSRWASRLAEELATTDFGVICVTRENVEAPWLLFEAGALSRWLEKGAVATVLLDLNSDDLSSSPLAQFQDTKLESPDIRRLVETINSKGEHPLDEKRLDTAFQVWWPQLQKKIEEAWQTRLRYDDYEPASQLRGKPVTLSDEQDLPLARWFEELARALKSRPYRAIARWNIKQVAMPAMTNALDSWTCPAHPRVVTFRIVEATETDVLVEVEACCSFALFVLRGHVAEYR